MSVKIVLCVPCPHCEAVHRLSGKRAEIGNIVICASCGKESVVDVMGIRPLSIEEAFTMAPETRAQLAARKREWQKMKNVEAQNTPAN